MQGCGGSHSAGGANAPPTFGPMAPSWEHAPPTSSAVKWLYVSYVNENGEVVSVRYIVKTIGHDNKLEKVAVAMHCNLRPSEVAPVVLT